MDTPIPMIRLEVDGMRHAISAAFLEAKGQIDADIMAGIDEYCKPENIQRVVRNAVYDTLNSVIKEEVQRFYTYGEGREVIKAAVIDKLKTDRTYTVLDEGTDEDEG